MTRSDPNDRAYCVAVLPKVSRTFALGIRILPRGIGHSVLVSYLLCRIADTVEDSAELPAAEKQRLLDHFRAMLDEGGPDAGPLADSFARRRTDEEDLATNADRVIREFRALAADERAAIRPWVQQMAAGMAEFAGPARQGAGGVRALQSVAELDRYCYYVAGTVGHLLTELFRLHLGAVGGERYERLAALATSFGLGLQLTNIIKDVADDQRRGWSFVPRDLCELAGIRPGELQDPTHASESREVMVALIDKAKTHLRDALDYCTALPFTAYRVRIFCLTSMYFAVRTLRLAEHDPRLLDPFHKVKISRRQVYRTVAVTHAIAPFNHLVRSYYRHLARAR